LLAGDPKESARAMARHIRSGSKYWSRALPSCSTLPSNQGSGCRSTPRNES
jgi:hypothetical protein